MNWIVVTIAWSLFVRNPEVEARNQATSPPSPAAALEDSADPTAALMAVLDDAFSLNDHNADTYRYWSTGNRYQKVWQRAVTLIERGADVRLAHQRGLSVWSLAFVGDPRCECAPYGWPPGSAGKCTNPDFFRGCYEVDKRSREDRVAKLLSLGVDPNLTVIVSSKSIGAPLCIAVGTGLRSAARALLAHQAACSARCQDTTVLHRAAVMDDAALLCNLIECGAQIDAADDRGNTPLMRAAEAGAARNVSILLDYGADPVARNGRGDDAVSLAKRVGKLRAVRSIQAWSAGRQVTRSHCRHSSK